VIQLFSERGYDIAFVNHITPKKSQLSHNDFSPIPNFQTT